MWTRIGFLLFVSSNDIDNDNNDSNHRNEIFTSSYSIPR